MAHQADEGLPEALGESLDRRPAVAGLAVLEADLERAFRDEGDDLERVGAAVAAGSARVRRAPSRIGSAPTTGHDGVELSEIVEEQSGGRLRRETRRDVG